MPVYVWSLLKGQRESLEGFPLRSSIPSLRLVELVKLSEKEKLVSSGRVSLSYKSNRLFFTHVHCVFMYTCADCTKSFRVRLYTTSVKETINTNSKEMNKYFIVLYHPK